MEINQRETMQEFNNLMHRLGPAFAREPAFKNAQNYIKGLLSTMERKNSWQLAEYLGDSTPYAIQQFIYRGRFNADELRDYERAYIIENLGDEDGVLVVDETGFLKQGKKSCGVKRQYSGTAGRVENCQIGVFLTYSSIKGHCPIDRRLYLPIEWANDTTRRRGAGVPEEIDFRTKPQLALRMIKEATSAKTPYRWVTGDCVYGDSRIIREWLERNRKNYVLCLSSKEYIETGDQYMSVGNILKDLPSCGWFLSSCGNGSKGARMYEWKTIEITPPAETGYKRWLLVRRSLTDNEDMQTYICFAPEGALATKFIEVAGTRWTVESCFKESKSLVGMDEYEFRSYDSWYKHITFACIALAFLTVMSSRSFDMKPLQEHGPASSSLDTFKTGRNLRV